ncbi:MAG: mechanosensitive ion channel family protein [Gammaproteobacteria bacterium]
MLQIMHALPGWLVSLVSLVLTVMVVVLASEVSFKLLSRMPEPTLQIASQRLRRPMRWLTSAVAARLVLLTLPLADRPMAVVAHFFELIAIATGAWFCIACFDIWRELLIRRHPLDTADNLRARQLHTQVQIIRRIIVALIAVLALAAMLITFPEVRAVGAALFASAGAAGLIMGLAARPAIGNLLAGLQVALSEPIRLDDVVIVQGEWGRIEEIRTTYVVVKIWDERRLIVPLSYFIEQPFQNWTRHTADLLGTVFLYVDYTLPVEPVRQELLRILQASKQWDRKVWGLQVTNATAQTMELRALMSAANSGDAWDLRCLVREQLITFLQKHYPRCLPLSRVRLQDQPQGPADFISPSNS